MTSLCLLSCRKPTWASERKIGYVRKVGVEDEDEDGGKKVTSDCSVNGRLERQWDGGLNEGEGEEGWINFYFMYLEICGSEICVK